MRSFVLDVSSVHPLRSLPPQGLIVGRAPGLGWILPLRRPHGGGGYDRIALREGDYCDLPESVASLAGTRFVW